MIGFYNETNMIDWLEITMTYSSSTSVTWKCTDKYTKDSTTASTFTASTDATNNCNMMPMKSTASFNNGKAYLKGHFNRKFVGDGSSDLDLKLGSINVNLKVSYPGGSAQKIGESLLFVNPNGAIIKRLSMLASLSLLLIMNI